MEDVHPAWGEQFEYRIKPEEKHMKHEKTFNAISKLKKTEPESAYQRGYLDGIGRECPHCKDYKAMYIKVRDELAAEQQVTERQNVVFPTMLRKMWSGGEVQAWLDENVNKEKNS